MSHSMKKDVKEIILKETQNIKLTKTNGSVLEPKTKEMKVNLNSIHRLAIFMVLENIIPDIIGNTF